MVIFALINRAIFTKKTVRARGMQAGHQITVVLPVPQLQELAAKIKWS
jgi:hypothetical protein